MLTDYVHRLWRLIDAWTVRRFGRIDEIREVFQRTHGKFLDVEAVSKMEGISRNEAVRILEDAVERGILVKVSLYNSPSTPAPVVVTPDEIGKTVTLSELGFEEPDPDREMTLSRFDTREIYVSPDALD